MTVSTTFNYPAFEPETLVAGDAWIFYRNLNDKGVTPTEWVLSYSFVPVTTGNSTFTITGSDNGDGRFIVNVDAATTIGYTPDTYVWQAYVTAVAGSERHTLYKGQSVVVADFATTPQANFQSGVKKTLDAIEALIAGKATVDQQTVSVAGRSISKMSIKDLMDALTFYKELYARELQHQRNEQKRPGPSKILTSFGSGGDLRPWKTQ